MNSVLKVSLQMLAIYAITIALYFWQPMAASVWMIAMGVYIYITKVRY